MKETNNGDCGTAAAETVDTHYFFFVFVYFNFILL